MQSVTHIQEPTSIPTRVAEFFSKLFDTSDFPARWQCGHWPAEVGWLHIGSDITIFLAYAAIPTALFLFIFRRSDVPMRKVFWLFILFILSCGVTHLLDATMFYYPSYRLLGLMKLVTAVISLTTAFTLIRLMPAALRLPLVISQHKAMGKELTALYEVEQRLVRARDELEIRSSQLTMREWRLRTAMLLGRVGAVRWIAQTGQIDWSMSAADLLLENPAMNLTNWSQVLEPDELKKLHDASAEALRSRGPLGVELRIKSTEGPPRIIRLTAAVESGVGEEPMLISGMFRQLPLPDDGTNRQS